ncbi:tyrosine-protein phosphatase [Mycobacterium sp. pUA109]|uniref:tyrosine-protein phosphatase n=1 Tax=Mycobacterium sp. pUA109 TaxID=3238982 RepID=UPI00351AFFD2
MTTDVRELDGAWNFRDVADATTIAPGWLFRSGELSELAEAGRTELRRLGITDVADLRSPREVERRGAGRVPDGVHIHLLPFPDLADDHGGNDESPHEHAFRRLMTERPDAESIADTAARYMTEEYRRFPTLPGARRAVHRVITLLGAGHRVLAHCFAGKDRTGLTIAVVLEAVGIDRDAIMADYLRSNDAVPQLRSKILEMISERAGAGVTPEVVTFSEARLTDEVLGVRADYLDTARRAIDDNYGSMAGFLRAAEVTRTDLDRLRSALLG